MSLLTRVVLIIAAALLPPLCMQVFNETALRTARQADVREQAVRAARGVAADLDRIIGGVRNAMVATSEFPAVQEGDPTGCATLLVSVNARLSFLQDMELIDEDGRSICDSHGGKTGRNRAGEASVQRARQHGTFAVGGFVTNNVLGVPSLSIAYPLDGGALAGAVLVADIDLSWLHDEIAEQGLPPQSSVTIADRDGTVLIRLPGHQGVGERLGQDYLWMLDAPQPSLREGTGSDGVSRIVGYLPLSATPNGLFVSVGFSTANAYAASDAAAMRGYALIAAGGLAALGLAAWLTQGTIARPVSAILQTTERWHAGDMGARVPASATGSELSRIARAVNNLLDAVAAAQTGLRVRLAELNAVYDAAPVGLGFVDRDLRYVTVNAKLSEISGLPIERHRGQPVHALQPEVAERLTHGLRSALAGERLQPMEIPYGSGDDGGDEGPRRLLISYQPAVAPDGQVLGAVVAMQDITELRHAEAALRDTLHRANAELERRMAERTRELDAEVRGRELAQAQLQQSQKMEVIGQLTGGVAHDFNNLLTAIIGNVELAKMRAPDRPDLQRLLGGAMRAAERGAALTQRMLAFGRRQYLMFQPVALPALLHGMADMLARSIGPQIDIRMQIPPTVRLARADPNQIELVLLNLVVNARDAMPDGGVIEIAVADEHVSGLVPHRAGLNPGDYVRISVSDTGTGMDPETHARAFEPFFTTKAIGKGSGLGLSMVHGVAVQSGGDAAIDSELGVGTTVMLWLPCAESGGQVTVPGLSPQLARAGGGNRVVVADDDADVLAFAASSLQEAGFLVESAGSGNEALELMRHAPPDLLVADLGMPGMTGLQLAAAARALWPDLPVLIATGYADGSEEPMGSLQLPVLSKPYKSADLVTRAADLLGLAQTATIAATLLTTGVL